VAFTVLLVPSVRETADRLNRTERRAYDAAVAALKGEGCKAGGKRLAAVGGTDYAMCQRSLYRAWRLTTVYRRDGSIVIVALGQHTKRENPNATLADVFPDLSVTGRRRSDQPPCCAEPREPPEMSSELDQRLFVLFGL
jgi:hypothetical protein